MEAEREKVHRANPQAFTRPQNTEINVAASESEFSELERRLSPSNLRRNNQVYTVDYSLDDVESHTLSGHSTPPRPFDLEETLRGTQRANQQIGIRQKYIGVIWENLSVYGSGGKNNFVKTFSDAVISFFNIFQTAKQILGVGKNENQVKILDSFRGVAKPGEMVLVLGRPGSGCSTFLKVIANQRFGYTKIDGEVLYGPADAKTFAKRYRGESVYNQEDDVHHPTLTVGQTLGFAVELKTPGKRCGGMSKAEFKEEVVKTLLKMFNIEHTRNKIVGSPSVRGVSGGERKRVSIAEMLTASATVCAWDNSTRGLDAVTALDYARSLRIMTNICKTTTFVSIYQASEKIYEEFDKVMVIDQGREIFFGPTHEARAYFEGLGFKKKPRMTTPEYLTGCTDTYEREYEEWFLAENNPPHTPETLAAAFSRSKHARDLDAEMFQYKQKLSEDVKAYNHFQAAVKDTKMKGVSRKSVYCAPFHLQVWVLMRRYFLIKWQDKFTLVVSWLTSIFIALVLGTLWYKVPTTSQGAFTRGGLLFIALLFNSLQAFGELGSTMMGRGIINKHKSYALYRPAALWLAQIFVDFVFAASKILVFSIIVYFMCGLSRNPGAFFIFYMTTVICYLSLTLIFRSLGCMCRNFDVAFKFVCIIITLLILTSGYLIQYQSQKSWLKWIYYINSLGLAFSILMKNEFRQINLACTHESLVPVGPGYNDITHQACTLPGGVNGLPEVSGSNYIREGFQLDPETLWINFGITIALLIFFLMANMMAGEYFTWEAGENMAMVFQKPSEERERLNAALMRRRDHRRTTMAGATDSSESKEGISSINSKAILTWEDLCYDVESPSGKMRLLNNIYGYVRPGSLTALMGASGAGKTTLLDVLAARKTVGVISGQLLIDGLKIGTSFQRGIGYAEQQDICEPTQTVREALRFSAELRQPYEVTRSEKYAFVEEVISLLEMEEMADAIIGDPETGLSVEQRKRVSIGIELAAKPELIFFLDEPTSGLDSQSAFNIIRFLRKLARAGQAILCTIHQPNSDLFEMFDNLLLLQRGGRTVYFGEIGEDSCTIRNYFERNGAHCQPDANVAEWMLEAIGVGQGTRIGEKDWADIWLESPDFNMIKENITQMKIQRRQDIGNCLEIDEKEFATPLAHQMKMVLVRTSLSFWRSPSYGFTRLFSHVTIALLTGISFLNLDNSLRALQYRLFVVFQATVLPAIILDQVEIKYALSRIIYYREASAKMYNQFTFASSLVITEMPYNLLCATVFYLFLHFLPRFSSAPSRAGYQYLQILVAEIFSVTFGQLLSAATPSPFISSLINPIITILFSLFCGVAILPVQMPKFWRYGLYEVNPFTRLAGGMITTELHKLPVICRPSDLVRFTAPEGKTCGEYMTSFFQNGGTGYLVQNSTSLCEYCQYKVGDEFYNRIGLNFDNRWRDLGIFISLVGSNLILLFLAARYLNFNRR